MCTKFCFAVKGMEEVQIRATRETTLDPLHRTATIAAAEDRLAQHQLTPHSQHRRPRHRNCYISRWHRHEVTTTPSSSGRPQIATSNHREWSSPVTMQHPPRVLFWLPTSIVYGMSPSLCLYHLMYFLDLFSSSLCFGLYCCFFERNWVLILFSFFMCKLKIEERVVVVVQKEKNKKERKESLLLKKLKRGC